MKRIVKNEVSKTKKDLLKAAGELVADMGLDGVSIREITERAKANMAAVNYHFGSREGLMTNLVTMHLLPIWEERKARLEVLEGNWSGKSVPLEELVDVWVRPVTGVALRGALGKATALKVTGRFLMMLEDEWPAEVRLVSQPVQERWQRILAVVLPGLEEEEARWRTVWLTGGLAQMLLQHWGHRKSGYALDQLERMSSFFLRFACAGLRTGRDEVAAVAPKKGPQAMFDF